MEGKEERKVEDELNNSEIQAGDEKGRVESVEEGWGDDEERVEEEDDRGEQTRAKIEG